MIISSDVKRDDEKLQEGISNSVLAVGKTHSFQHALSAVWKAAQLSALGSENGPKSVPIFQASNFFSGGKKKKITKT